ncbi:hypothetical protein N0Y54_33900 [Nostoc punctiforme UO1]
MLIYKRSSQKQQVVKKSDSIMSIAMPSARLLYETLRERQRT